MFIFTVVLGLTVLGIAQLITGIIYMVVAKFASFSSSFMFVCAGAGSAGITFMFMSCPNVGKYTPQTRQIIH